MFRVFVIFIWQNALNDLLMMGPPSINAKNRPKMLCENACPLRSFKKAQKPTPLFTLCTQHSEDDIWCRKCAFTKRTQCRSKKVAKMMKNTQKFQTRNEGLFYKCLNKFMKIHELYVVSGLR